MKKSNLEIFIALNKTRMKKSALEIFIALHNTRTPEDAFTDDLYRMTDKHFEKVARKLFTDVIGQPRHRQFQKRVWREIKLLIIESIDPKLTKQLDKALKHDD